MKMVPIPWRPAAAAIMVMTNICLPLRADEGMWLFNHPPRKRLQEKYGFDATDAWLEHVQKSSVRFNSGGSGSFVSEDGLVLSNHHVGADALQKFGDRDHDYLREGFRARTTDRLLRRRPGQLRVSAFRSGYLFVPRLRRRQACPAPALLEVERGRCFRRGTGPDPWSSGPHQPPLHGGRTGIRPRPS